MSERVTVLKRECKILKIEHETVYNRWSRRPEAPLIKDGKLKLPGSMPRNRQKIIEALSKVGLELPTKDWLDENKDTSSSYYWCQDYSDLIYCPSTKKCLDVGSPKIKICLIGLRAEVETEIKTEIKEPVETKAEINQNSLPETQIYLRKRNYCWELQEQPARKFLTRIGVLYSDSKSCETILNRFANRFASFLKKKQRLRKRRKHQDSLWENNEKLKGSSN